MVKVTSVLVNGTEIKSVVYRWNILKTYGDTIASVKIECTADLDSLLTVTNGQTLEVWRGAASADYRWFKGKVNTVEPNGATIVITGVSDFADERNAPITKSYDYGVDPSAGVISAIALDMVTTHGGMTADATTFVNSGTANIITRWVCNSTDVLNSTKKILSYIDYYHYFDDHLAKVFAQPIGYVTSSTVLTVGDNVLNVPKWKYDRTPIINYVEVTGAEDTVWTTEFFSGDGTTDTFELAKATKHVDVYVGGVEQVAGKTGSSSGAYDYQVDNDFENLTGIVVSRIIFEAGSIPGVGVNNIEIPYAYGMPTIVRERDSASITKFGRKLMQISLFEAKSVADATTIARGIIQKRKDEFISSTLEVDTAEGLHEGMAIPVVDSINGVNLTLAISQLEIRWPDDTDKVTVGDSALRITDFIYSIADRLSALEKEQSKNQDLLYQGFDLERNLLITRTLQRTMKKNYNTFEVGTSPIGEGATTYTTTADFNKGTVTGDCIIGTNQLELDLDRFRTLDGDCRALYQCDDGAGGVLSDDTTTYDGTLGVGCSWVIDGGIGNVLQFTAAGSAQGVNLPAAAANNMAAGTVEFLIKIAAADYNSHQSIICKQHNAVNSYLATTYYGTTHKITFQLSNGHAISTTGTLSADNWTHVAFTWDGVNIKSYIGGTLDNTVVDSGTLPDDNAITGFYFGSPIGDWNAGSPTTCQFGGLCISNVARTSFPFASGSGTWTGDKLYFSNGWGWNIDCFSDADVSDWALTGANWTVTADATSQLEGTNSMKIVAAANSSGTYVKKPISNEDASDYRYLYIYAKANSTTAQLLKVTLINNGVDTDLGYITLTASGVAQDFSFDLNAITHNDIEGIKITSNSNATYTAYIDRVVLTNDDALDTSTFKSITWNETGIGVTCDILNANTGATLVSDYVEGSDLKPVLPIDTPIKVKLNLTGNPTVQDVTVNWIAALIEEHYGEEETA